MRRNASVQQLIPQWIAAGFPVTIEAVTYLVTKAMCCVEVEGRSEQNEPTTLQQSGQRRCPCALANHRGMQISEHNV